MGRESNGMNPLADKVALVSGGGGGIGGAVALVLAAAGARVVIAGRRPAPLAKTAALLRAVQPACSTLTFDLTRDGDVERAARTLERDPGRLDILVHAAGLHALVAIADTPAEDFDALFATNVRGPWLLTKALLPMLGVAHGDVVFVNSSAVRQPRAGVGAYAASKLALLGVADSLRDQLNPSGIRVLSVFPGRTATEMQAGIHQSQDVPYRPELLLQPEDVALMIVAAIALPRTAEVTDLHLRPRAGPTA